MSYLTKKNEEELKPKRIPEKESIDSLFIVDDESRVFPNPNMSQFLRAGSKQNLDKELKSFEVRKGPLLAALAK